ncbi:MAG: hypothetical protein ACJ76I_07190 [Gaiellaceae bacterium]
MRKLFFLLVLMCVLATAPSALADTQELLITPFSTTAGAKADTDIDVFVPDTAAPTAKIAIYVPTGFDLDLSGAPGAKIGDAAAQVLAKQLGGTKLDLAGTITVDDPAKYGAANTTAQACDANAHAAVWLVTLTASDQSLAIPVFVDRTTGSDTALGSFVLQTCLASPDVPTDQGGAPVGAQLIDLTLETTGVVINASAGNPVWKGFITPFTPGTATPDATGVVEVRCVEPLPHAVSRLKSVYSTKTKKVTITGVVMAGGKPRAGVHFRIDAGTKPSIDALKPWAVATTDARGAFSIVKPLPKTLYAFAYVNPYYSLTCQSGPSTAPKGCVREDTSAEYGPVFVLKPKK